jgi:hypothetical protein
MTKKWGLNVDFANGSARHFPGESALADARAYAALHETSICCISTPESILRDLRRQPPPLRVVSR